RPWEEGWAETLGLRASATALRPSALGLHCCLFSPTPSQCFAASYRASDGGSRKSEVRFYICLQTTLLSELWGAESSERCENRDTLVVEQRAPLPAPPRESGCNVAGVFRV